MGRPRDPIRHAIRQYMSYMSDRTFARFWHAQRQLLDLGGQDVALDAIRAATRPNGSFNVAEYQRQAEVFVCRWVADHEHELDDIVTDEI